MHQTKSPTLPSEPDPSEPDPSETPTNPTPKPKPSHYITLVFDWALKILTLLSTIIFGIWAPITYIATLKSNKDNDSSQRLLLEELKRMSSIQSSLVEEMRDMRGKFEVLVEGKAWEFCGGVDPEGKTSACSWVSDPSLQNTFLLSLLNSTSLSRKEAILRPHPSSTIPAKTAPAKPTPSPDMPPPSRPFSETITDHISSILKPVGITTETSTQRADYTTHAFFTSGLKPITDPSLTSAGCNSYRGGYCGEWSTSTSREPVIFWYIGVHDPLILDFGHRWTRLRHSDLRLVDPALSVLLVIMGWDMVRRVYSHMRLKRKLKKGFSVTEDSYVLFGVLWVVLAVALKSGWVI